MSSTFCLDKVAQRVQEAVGTLSNVEKKVAEKRVCLANPSDETFATASAALIDDGTLFQPPSLSGLDYCMSSDFNINYLRRVNLELGLPWRGASTSREKRQMCDALITHLKKEVAEREARIRGEAEPPTTTPEVTLPEVTPSEEKSSGKLEEYTAAQQAEDRERARLAVENARRLALIDRENKEAAEQAKIQALQAEQNAKQEQVRAAQSAAFANQEVESLKKRTMTRLKRADSQVKQATKKLEHATLGVRAATETLQTKKMSSREVDLYRKKALEALQAQQAAEEELKRVKADAEKQRRSLQQANEASAAALQEHLASLQQQIEKEREQAIEAKQHAANLEESRQLLTEAVNESKRQAQLALEAEGKSREELLKLLPLAESSGTVALLEAATAALLKAKEEREAALKLPTTVSTVPTLRDFIITLKGQNWKQCFSHSDVGKQYQSGTRLTGGAIAAVSRLCRPTEASGPKDCVVLKLLPIDEQYNPLEPEIMQYLTAGAQKYPICPRLLHVFYCAGDEGASTPSHKPSTLGLVMESFDGRVNQNPNSDVFSRTLHTFDLSRMANTCYLLINDGAVLHGDLKPDQYLVNFAQNPDGTINIDAPVDRVVITDFGASVNIADLKSAGCPSKWSYLHAGWTNRWVSAEGLAQSQRLNEEHWDAGTWPNWDKPGTLPPFIEFVGNFPMEFSMWQLESYFVAFGEGDMIDTKTGIPQRFIGFKNITASQRKTLYNLFPGYLETLRNEGMKDAQSSIVLEEGQFNYLAGHMMEWSVTKDGRFVTRMLPGYLKSDGMLLTKAEYDAEWAKGEEAKKKKEKEEPLPDLKTTEFLVDVSGSRILGIKDTTTGEVRRVDAEDYKSAVSEVTSNAKKSYEKVVNEAKETRVPIVAADLSFRQPLSDVAVIDNGALKRSIKPSASALVEYAETGNATYVFQVPAESGVPDAPPIDLPATAIEVVSPVEEKRIDKTQKKVSRKEMIGLLEELQRKLPKTDEAKKEQLVRLGNLGQPSARDFNSTEFLQEINNKREKLKHVTIIPAKQTARFSAPKQRRNYTDPTDYRLQRYGGTSALEVSLNALLEKMRGVVSEEIPESESHDFD